jgi:hypothetical protein
VFDLGVAAVEPGGSDQQGAELLVAGIGGGEAVDCLGEQVGGDGRGAVDELRPGLGEPVDDPPVGDRPGAAGGQQLLGDPFGGGAGGDQRLRRLQVQRASQPGRDSCRQRITDQAVPEHQSCAGFGQDAGGDALLHDRNQAGGAATGHHREIGDRELRTEQGGDLQGIGRLTCQEPQPVGDRGRQRSRGSARAHVHVGHSGAVCGLVLTDHGVDDLAEVERVAAGPLRQLPQARAGS